MPGSKGPKTHEQARLHCCAACGRGGVKLTVTPALENMIKKYVHPAYDVNIESYPIGCCDRCKVSMYRCRKAEESSESVEPWRKKEWDEFKLEDIHVPRTSAECGECPCPIRHCSHFNPCGVTGKKDIIHNPVINPDGGQMKCETDPPVMGRGRNSSKGLCCLCGQITGRGLSHPCRQVDIQAVKHGQADVAKSLDRSVVNRRKRNLSLLVGKEEEGAQEEIISVALNRIAERKGDKFRLKLMGGGGVCGQGKEVTIGEQKKNETILPIEVFQEIKKCLYQSKKKMEEMGQILRKNKVKMIPDVRKQLKDIDHLLDDEYVTVKMNFTETVTVEVKGNNNNKKSGGGKVKKPKTEQCLQL